MSGDYWNPNEGLPNSDPYNSEALRYRKVSNGARSRYVPDFRSEPDLNFDPRIDYVAGGILLREQILEAFGHLRHIALQPSAFWRSRDSLHRPTGTLIHQTKLIVDATDVYEHVTLATHENQHLIDATKYPLHTEVRKLARTLPPTPETQNGLTYIWSVLTQPVRL